MTDQKVLALVDGQKKEVVVEQRQEVIIGTPVVAPAYPALVFVERIIDGQTVYEMKVSNGIA